MLKTWHGENDGWKNWWNIKINVQKLADVRGYELPTNLQNITQKDLTEVKIFQNVLGGYYFSKHPVHGAAKKTYPESPT